MVAVPDTDPFLKTMDVVEAAAVLAFDQDANAPIVRLTDSEQSWEPLKVRGFERIQMFRKFETEEHPQQHVLFKVSVWKGSLASFPRGLILRYAMDREALGGILMSNALRKLRAFALGHLKVDLTAALVGKLIRSHEHILFLNHRGWVKKTW